MNCLRFSSEDTTFVDNIHILWRYRSRFAHLVVIFKNGWATPAKNVRILPNGETFGYSLDGEARAPLEDVKEVKAYFSH